MFTCRVVGLQHIRKVVHLPVSMYTYILHAMNNTSEHKQYGGIVSHTSYKSILSACITDILCVYGKVYIQQNVTYIIIVYTILWQLTPTRSWMFVLIYTSYLCTKHTVTPFPLYDLYYAYLLTFF